MPETGLESQTEMETPDPFQKETPSTSSLPSVFTIFNNCLHFIEDNGWYILIVIVIVTYIYNTRLKSHFQRLKQRRDEEEYAAKYHKNPDLLQSRLAAQQTYAQKLQEKYDREAEQYKQKQEEREVQNREEFIAKYDGVGGSRLGSKDDDKAKKSFKPEYHPLMGSGSSSNYRPPKRSKCGGGGCGK